MTCYSPLTGYRSRTPGINGGFQIKFKKSGSNGQLVTVACGQCIGCRLDKSKDWAIRCIHESQMHDENSFITLTYNNEHLPLDESLNVQHFQKFMKRLRGHYKPKKIRFLHSGEYGSTCPSHNKENCEQCGKLQRPHYHALLFNLDFADKTFWKFRRDYKVYRSETLQKIWGKGNIEIGNLTFESAAYVARYTTKKITGDDAHAHYEKIDTQTGEIHGVTPEYITMSRRPGIGYSWYQKYKSDLFPRDECVIDGRILKPPRYYAKMYQQEEPELYEQMQNERQKFYQKHKQDSTWQRLSQREKVKHAQLHQLTRQLEQDQ